MAKRQRRAARAQKEFIPLGKDGRSSAGSTPDHCSRGEEEDRVEDDDDEPDDHERRIEFAPRMKSIRERIAEKLGTREVCPTPPSNLTKFVSNFCAAKISVCASTFLNVLIIFQSSSKVSVCLRAAKIICLLTCNLFCL